MAKVVGLEMPDIEGAVYDFIAECIKPAIAPDNIIRGWQNYSSLPKDTNEYSVYTVLFDNRNGTNVRKYADGVQSELRQSICDVQIDFCSQGNKAMERALCLNTIARSPAGVEFFKPYGIGCLYAEEPKAMEYIDGEDLYIRRWMSTLRLSFWTKVSMEEPSFNNVKIKRIENVDVFHSNKTIK